MRRRLIAYGRFYFWGGAPCLSIPETFMLSGRKISTERQAYLRNIMPLGKELAEPDASGFVFRSRKRLLCLLRQN